MTFVCLSYRHVRGVYMQMPLIFISTVGDSSSFFSPRYLLIATNSIYCLPRKMRPNGNLAYASIGRSIQQTMFEHREQSRCFDRFGRSQLLSLFPLYLPGSAYRDELDGFNSPPTLLRRVLSLCGLDVHRSIPYHTLGALQYPVHGSK